MTKTKQKKRNSDDFYSLYWKSKKMYPPLKKYEISMKVPEIKEDQSLIIRLDGIKMSARFKNKEEMFLFEFYDTMKNIIQDVRKYFPFVEIAYSFKDEISLLIGKEQIQHNKYQNRIEKILPIFSGYISSLFSQYLPKKLKKSPCEAFSFDARLILLPTSQLKYYFRSRQAFAMRSFIDRFCSYRYPSTTKKDKKIIFEIEKEIKEKKEWEPLYSGYVGFFDNGEWQVQIADNFMKCWDKYEKTGVKYETKKSN